MVATVPVSLPFIATAGSLVLHQGWHFAKVSPSVARVGHQVEYGAACGSVGCGPSSRAASPSGRPYGLQHLGQRKTSTVKVRRVKGFAL